MGCSEKTGGSGEIQALLAFYCRSVGLDQARADIKQVKYSQARCYRSNSVEHPTDSNLFIPKIFFGGVVIFLVGLWLSAKGVNRGPLVLWFVGWPLAVAGVVAVLWSIFPMPSSRYAECYGLNNTYDSQRYDRDSIFGVGWKNI